MGYDFPISCLGVMADLWFKDGVSQKELGISLIKTKSSITKMLGFLQDANLIYKKENPADQRSKLIYLTEEGKYLQKYVKERATVAEKVLLSDINEHDKDTTKRVLKVLYQNLSNEIFEQNKNLNNE